MHVQGLSIYAVVVAIIVLQIQLHFGKLIYLICQKTLFLLKLSRTAEFEKLIRVVQIDSDTKLT